MSEDIKRIAKLNDQLRIWGTGGRILVTATLKAKGEEFLQLAVQEMRMFSSFSEDNDPHGEHDFGSFNLEGEKIFWKVDYYDQSMKNGSENPANPEITTRVLTLMLASDY